MTESNAGDATGQAPEGSQGQDPAAAAANGQDPKADAGADTVEARLARLAELEKENGELRKENAKRRTENQRLTEAQQAEQDAKLSEVERLQKQLAKAEADKAAAEEQRKEQVLRTAVIGTAARLGFRDPEDAYRLLRPSEVEYDDTGEPSNIKPLLETMLKAKDYLVGARLPGGAWDGAAGGSRAPKPTDIETAVEAHYAKAGRT
jgi:hypothetical protein